ncbi:unnamed protein product, partial [Brassica rapa]
WQFQKLLLFLFSYLFLSSNSSRQTWKSQTKRMATGLTAVRLVIILAYMCTHTDIHSIHVSFILRLTFIFVDCGSACIARCRLSSRPNLCHRACGTCCARCNCVPPGTYGNYDKCKCYASLTTHGGRHKCP